MTFSMSTLSTLHPALESRSRLPFAPQPDRLPEVLGSWYQISQWPPLANGSSTCRSTSSPVFQRKVTCTGPPPPLSTQAPASQWKPSLQLGEHDCGWTVCGAQLPTPLYVPPS